jgi:hypothetical protein
VRRGERDLGDGGRGTDAQRNDNALALVEREGEVEASNSIRVVHGLLDRGRRERPYQIFGGIFWVGANCFAR